MESDKPYNDSPTAWEAMTATEQEHLKDKLLYGIKLFEKGYQVAIDNFREELAKEVGTE